MPNPNLSVAAPIIDYDAARTRLAPLTNDPAALAGLERVRENGDLDDAFLEAIMGADISLDYIFMGEGEPYRTSLDGLDDTVKAFIGHYRLMTPNQRRIMGQLSAELAEGAA